ncbi:MAG: hypothetical protein QM638_15565 [Nocardioides sp.]|uniref:hypothetical protein n=1 Tax=Nocardioides sp. TaxID=35761 RepID=UPI0039E30CF5
MAACYALIPFGGLLGGGLVSTLGFSSAMLICAAAYLAVTMLPAVDTTWRQIDVRDPAAARAG